MCVYKLPQVNCIKVKAAKGRDALFYHSSKKQTPLKHLDDRDWEDQIEQS